MPLFKLEDFHLLQPLGGGTVGAIYAVRLRDPSKVKALRISGDSSLANQEDGQQPPLALKILHDSVADDQLIRARFRREIAVLRRMQHPNIIHCYGSNEPEERLFYVMERIDGGSIRDLLSHRGRLPWPVVVSVLKQTASALQCAHNHGVVHRDLKPSNLYLTAAGHVKLADFGIARDLQNADLTSAGITVGTHPYMAPEQIVGDRSVSGKADLYSLGCCAFEMLCGRPPFVGQNAREVLEQHLRIAPPHIRELGADCPQELEAVVEQMLAKNPEQRPFNARSIQGLMLQIMQAHPEAFPTNANGQENMAHATGKTILPDDNGQHLLAILVRQQMGMLERPVVGRLKIIAILVLLIVVVAIAIQLQAN